MIKKFLKLPLNKKITYIVLFYLCLAVAICIGVFCYTYYDTSVNNMLSNMDRQSYLLSQSIERQLEMYINITDNVFSNKRLMNILSEKDSGAYSTIKYSLDIQEFMQDISASAGGVQDMCFENVNGDMVAIGNLPREVVTYGISDIRQRIERDGTEPHLGAFSYENEAEIVLGRKVMSVDELYGRSYNGIIYIFINADSIFKRYINLFGEKSRVYMVDEEKRILLDSTGKNVGKMLMAESYNRGGTEYIEIDGKKYYCLSSDIDDIGCKMIFAEECDEVTRPIRDVILKILAAMIVILLLLAFTVRFVSEGIAKPIRAISEEIDNIRETRFKKKLPEDVDEILYPIVKSYNMMIDTLDNLINKELAYQVKFKEAAFRAYEQQINPHFICNTLNMVNVLANYGESEKIDIVVSGISDMMKFANLTNQDVLIADEISNIESYFSILDIRFGEGFKHNIYVSPEAEACGTFKFILQPIVENAVKHGIEKIDEDGIIDISVDVKDGYVEFTVEDNGVGITEEKLREIMDKLEVTDVYSRSVRKGIGITNVYQRGKLKYGDDFSLNIESTAGRGTRVIIKHIAEMQKSDCSEADVNIRGDIL